MTTIHLNEMMNWLDFIDQSVPAGYYMAPGTLVHLEPCMNLLEYEFR